jgi:hypothetical protein
MKIALLINQKNMEKYSNKGDLRSSWELIHLGNGDVADSDIIATGAEVVVADAVNPVSAAVINAMPSLSLYTHRVLPTILLTVRPLKKRAFSSATTPP